ncbi:CsgE family curli-type amyloid fiber assembly protein [Prolixibacter sp. SD074]|uniref:CsgE family curli-type amyloid fiber assembly protein n=1 Tax=Prolixibacter sp. SD074 TaxID=2652391 RepID=UPI00126F1F80|nr:CsgE family curli-type amyloid fiber assembly protein [Prolixibacter sp. SD074]GET28607.1 hypothetical protein SD074_08090 [Prolixibacter sp. SD074]
MKKELTKHFYLAAFFLLILNLQAKSQTFPSGNFSAGNNTPQIVHQDSTVDEASRSALYKVPDTYSAEWKKHVDEILNKRPYPDTIYVDGVKVLLALKPIPSVPSKQLSATPDSPLNKLGDLSFRQKAFQKMMLEKLVSLINEQKQKESENALSVEIDGLVVDETLSKVGRDFYEAFYSKWVAPVDAKDYTLFIKESPPRINRVMVSIYVNDDEVFSSYLSPREEIINAYADYAVSQVQTYLKRRENVSQTLEDPDMMGNGIY